MDHVRASLARGAARDAAAPYWRSNPRREVDYVWEGLRTDALERFGRAPSVDPWNQPSDELAVLLANASDAETLFIRAASSAASTPAMVVEAREAFQRAVVGFANAATRGWASRAVYEAEVRRRLEWR
jgi:hypothetical protein